MEKMEQMGAPIAEQSISQTQKIEQEIEDVKKQITQLEKDPSYSIRIDRVNAQGEQEKFSSKQNREEQILTLEQQIRELEIQKNIAQIEESSKAINHIEEFHNETPDDVLEEKAQEQIEAQDISKNTLEEELPVIEDIESKETATPLDIPPMPTPDFEVQSKDPIVLALQKVERLSSEYDKKYVELMKFQKTNLISRFFKRLIDGKNITTLEQDVQKTKRAYELAQQEYLDIVKAKK